MVRCVDCGFLASRNIETRELEETEAIFREFGRRPTTGQVADGVWVHLHENVPLCFARCDHLNHDITRLVAGNIEEPILAAIRMDRDCQSFTEWHQGFAPKEHREMLDREEWRKWREERERADREWRAAQDLLNKEWQAQENRRMVLYSGGFTVVAGVVGAAVGAAIAAIVSWSAYGGSD